MMEKFYTLLVLSLFPLAGIMAQKPISVSDDTVKIGNSYLPGFSVVIPEVTYDETLKSWIKGLQSNTKSKVLTDNDQMSIFGARIKDISDAPINVYSTLKDLNGDINLKVAMELKKDQYIEKSNPGTEYSKARSYLFDFAKEKYIDIVKTQIKKEEDVLRSLERELASLERERERMENSTTSNYKAITEEKQIIAEFNNQVASLEPSITQQNSEITGMGGRESESKADYIKDMEKQRKKAIKEIESSEKKITRAENEIGKNKNEIQGNTRQQDELREKISAQKAVFQQFENKLETIKDYR